MRHGTVVKIRLNPEDCMAVVDILKAGNSLIPGMSFAGMARLVFSGMLEAARKQGIVPRREGYEFNEIVGPLLKAPMVRKQQLSDVMEQAEMKRVVNDMPAVAANVTWGSRPVQDEEELNDAVVIQRARLMVKINELSFKQKNDPDNWTLEDAAELSNAEAELRKLDV